MKWYGVLIYYHHLDFNFTSPKTKSFSCVQSDVFVVDSIISDGIVFINVFVCSC